MFHTFAQKLVDLAHGVSLHPREPCGSFLPHSARTPSLANRCLSLWRTSFIDLEEGSGDYAGEDYTDRSDYAGTERDFWRLCHLGKVLTWIYTMDQAASCENSLLRSLSGYVGEF